MRYKTIQSISWKQRCWRIAAAVGIFASFVAGAGLYLAQPSCSRSEPTSQVVNLRRMEETVKTLSVDFHPRSFEHPKNLDRTAEYIYRHFQQAGGEPEYQTFNTRRREYKNVRCIFRNGQGRRIVIGAHYDSCGDTPGADDNASGVAGLIELAYLVSTDESLGEVELVAYSLEEPPFFRTKEMGSFFHAQSLVKNRVDVQGVIVLEMIGYFTDSPRSQKAPMILLKFIYPNRGNYILVAGHDGQRAFTKEVKTGMKGATELDVYSICAPKTFPGIDFSDHRNYWVHRFNAVMVTDTAFFRNEEYHSAGDTYDRLDYRRMGDTVLSVHSALSHMRAKSE